jgi:hypothetical protein
VLLGKLLQVPLYDITSTLYSCPQSDVSMLHGGALALQYSVWPSPRVRAAV